MKRVVSEIKEECIRKKIVIINFLLSLIILIYHANCVDAMLYETKDFFYYLSTGVTNFGFCAVPSFFMLSAFLFYRNFSISQYGTKLKKRFKSLCVPYLIWNIFYCILFVSFHYIPIIREHTHSTSVFNIIDNLIGILMSDYTPLWFVRDLIMYVILAPIIYYIVKSRIVGLVLIAISVITNLIFITFPYESIFYWLPIYLIGAYFGLHYSDKIMTMVFTSTKLFVFCSFAFLVSFTFLCIDKNSYTFFIYRLFSPIGLWIIMDFIFNYEKIKMRDSYTYSFFIYANHFFILTGLQRIMTESIPLPTLAYGINYLIVPPFVLLLLIIVGKLLKRNFTSFYYITTGNR